MEAAELDSDLPPECVASHLAEGDIPAHGLEDRGP